MCKITTNGKETEILFVKIIEKFLSSRGFT